MADHYNLTRITDQGAKTAPLSEITVHGVRAAAAALGVPVANPEMLAYDLAAAWLNSGRVEGAVTTDQGTWMVRRRG